MGSNVTLFKTRHFCERFCSPFLFFFALPLAKGLQKHTIFCTNVSSSSFWQLDLSFPSQEARATFGSNLAGPGQQRKVLYTKRRNERSRLLSSRGLQLFCRPDRRLLFCNILLFLQVPLLGRVATTDGRHRVFKICLFIFFLKTNDDGFSLFQAQVVTSGDHRLLGLVRCHDFQQWHFGHWRPTTVRSRATSIP